MKTWITADWHLGENRFELIGRSFSTADDMINSLVDNYNQLVAPDDKVYVVGDVCYQNARGYLPLTSRFNGKKILIRGNHDRVFTDNDFSAYFEEIIPEGKGIELDVEGIPCYITHYPSEGRNDRFNLVGHIHSAWKYQLNSLNIGVDVNHFRPVCMDKIPFHFKTICEFYDEDVWVGYKNINADFLGKRGKKGTYFKPIS